MGWWCWGRGGGGECYRRHYDRVVWIEKLLLPRIASFALSHFGADGGTAGPLMLCETFQHGAFLANSDTLDEKAWELDFGKNWTHCHRTTKQSATGDRCHMRACLHRAISVATH